MKTIVANGHEVWAQRDCGKSAGFSNEEYKKAGAKIIDTAEEIWANCDMVAKVKEFLRKKVI